MHAEARAHVPLPVEKAWPRLAELSALHEWAPDVTASPADPLRVGATRWAKLREPASGKDTLVERVVDVDERGHAFTYDIEGGIGPLRAIRTTWRLDPTQGGCTVVVTSEVTLSPAARLLSPIVKRAWRKQLQALADGFAAWASARPVRR